MMRYFLIISVIIAPKKEVFPADLVPATRSVLEPSTRKLIIPAASGVIILFCMNRGSVHGLSLWRLNAYAIPVGFKGGATTATLAFAFGNTSSVSSIGLASSSGLAEMSLSFDAHDSPSVI